MHVCTFNVYDYSRPNPRSSLAAHSPDAINVYPHFHHAVAQNPINNYAPTVNVNCPETTAGPLVRTFTPQFQVLNTLAAEYIAS